MFVCTCIYCMLIMLLGNNVRLCIDDWFVGNNGQLYVDNRFVCC